MLLLKMLLFRSNLFLLGKYHIWINLGYFVKFLVSGLTQTFMVDKNNDSILIE